ncbi:MAG: hypothetical protein JKY54_00570, partial [Flavobacteriales bacterium]|nr:hypothetical protein [Flavobacteriales bacterium]
CSAFDSILVIVNSLPITDAGPATATICDGDSISIGGSPSATGGTSPYYYSWTPNSNINDSTFTNPMVDPSVNTTYILLVSDSNSCVAIDSI